MAKRRSVPVWKLSHSRSVVLIPCYAMHGKGRHHRAGAGAELVAVLVNERRQVREAGAVQAATWEMTVEGFAYPAPWKVLGWRMADGSKPLGEHDMVDPMLADLARLRDVNKPEFLGASAYCNKTPV